MKLMKSKVVALVLAVAMVLSVIAVPASAVTTQPTTTTAAATWLKSVNLLQGDDSGNLMLDQNLTREQMMVIVSRLLGAEASAKVYPTTTMTFKDVPAGNWAAGYVAWAQAEGITQGYNADKFGFGDPLTPWQTAAFMVRALGYVDTPDDEIEAKADLLGILDNSTVNSDIAATAPILRGDMALLMSNALYAETSEETILGEDLGVLDGVGTLTMSATAASVQSFKVTFSGAVADTSAVTFAVKKDDVGVNVSSTAWNTAKTEATLTMVSKLTEGSYVITVGGVTLVASSATVTVKDEETGKIEFLTDKAILADDTDDADDDVYTYIKATNQYGEDITEDVTLTFTASQVGLGGIALDGDTGKVTIDGAYDAEDVIVVTALDETSGAFGKATLTVVDAASADSVEVVKLYNADEDAVLEVGAAPADFKLLVKVKDQYGYEMATADAEAGLIVSTTESVLTVAKLVGTNTPDFDGLDVTIDDVDYTALSLATIEDDGVSTVRFISTTTGKTTTYNLTVKAAADVDTITVSNPTIAVEDENIDFLVTGTDQYGAACTSVLDFAGVDVTISGAGITPVSDTFVKVDGKIYLRVEVSTDATVNKTMYVNFVTATNKIVQKSIAVRPAAVPTVIAKIQGVKTGIVEGNTSEIELSSDDADNNIVIYDQYDRAMDVEDVIDGVNYKLTFVVDDGVNVDLDVAELLGEGVVTMTGLDKGSDKVTIEIFDILGAQNDGVAAPVADSGLDFTATVVEVADIVSYNVEAIDTVYAKAAAAVDVDYAVDVDVYGVLSNGTKVALPSAMYSIVSATTGLELVPGTATIGAFDGVDGVGGVSFATDAKTATGSLTITVGGAEGPVTFNPTVNISNVTPKVDTFELIEVGAATVSGNTATFAVADPLQVAGVALAIADLLAVVEETDQYGVATVALGSTSDADQVPASIIFTSATDADDDDSLILTNKTGALVPSIVGAEADDTFTVTLIYTNGKSFTFNVTISE